VLRIDRGAVLKASVVAMVTALGVGFAQATPVQAQAPLFLVNGDTRIESLSYRFEGGRTLDLDVIAGRTALSGPGILAGVRGALAWLPLIEPADPIAFRPIELQKDVVRLERLYSENGFPLARISWDVQLDTVSNAVSVRYDIVEGPALILDSVRVDIGERDQPMPLPVELTDSWERLTAQISGARGVRLSDRERVRLRSRPLSWARDRGYPFAQVSDTVVVDSTTWRAEASIRLDLGPRARVDSIAIEGNQALSRGVLLRELPLRTGDWFSQQRLSDGQRQIFGLELVRLALADVPAGQLTDSTVTVRYRVEEGKPRLLSGEAGYSSDGGVRGQADWRHRDFRGEARVLSVTADARTSWLALESAEGQRYGVSATVRQPYVFDRRVSARISPFISYRDGTVDQSWSYGLDTGLLWEKGTLASVSLDYRWSQRQVLSVLTGIPQPTDGTLFDVIASLDSLEGGAATSVLSLSSIQGRLDNPLDPRRGWVARASASAAGPSAISSVEYLRGQLDASVYLPVGRDAGLALKAGVAGLRPYGVSAPMAGSDTLALLVRLREAMLTAGGTESVRGWGSGLLGPKVPNYRLVPVADSVVLSADRYLPFSGLRRLTTSIELRLPMPFADSEHGTYVYLDGGKVWNPDPRFGGDAPDPLGEEDFFWGTGAGVRFDTPVGAVRFSLGYKLNPSILDVRDPQAVATAIASEQSILSVPEETFRRFHLHLSIGRGF